MRLELIAPGPTIVEPNTYNALFTLHGVIMIFLFIIPGIPAALGNFFLPIQIGAPDVAFPRLNLLSWWLYMIGAAIALSSLFAGGGPPDTGWTFYAPYSIRTGTNVVLATPILSITLLLVVERWLNLGLFDPAKGGTRYSISTSSGYTHIRLFTS